MIIHKPKIKKEDGRICVSSFIEVESDESLSDTLWFKFPEDHEKFVSDNSNGFVVAMLPLAMSLGEDIKVKGRMSSKLAYGLKQYQGYFNFWFPDNLKIVNIICDDFESENKIDVKGVVCSFSGGVDSFYTLYSHLPENEKDIRHQISHCLFVHGFDIPLNDKKSYDLAKNSYEKLANKLKIKLISTSTNIRDLLDKKISWEITHGAALASVALTLSNLISRFYIASSRSIIAWGSNPITDSLLSTEKLEFLNYRSYETRINKTRMIAHYPETYDNLRVCWERPDGLKNCCRCEKCIRTMVTLELMGVLSKYKTFPKPLTREKVKNWPLKKENEIRFAKEIQEYALRKGRKDLEKDILIAIKNYKC
ncbi:hypothetical protein KY331_00545 [Candidatus Woesearchaeota archaeon]|nr:hypothetical protein [Candidatus Woesearchaeota archaeon]